MTQNAVRRFVLEPAERDPGAVALIDGPSGRPTTRAELADGVLRVAGALAALGVRSEQRIMMVMADRPSFLEVFWGAIAHGAIPVPVSTMLTAKDYRFLIEDSRATTLVVSDLFVDQVLPAIEGQPFLERIIGEGPGRPAGLLPFEQLRDQSDPGSIFPADDEDIAFWLYTSGTTGFPKGALHRHGDMGFLTDTYARGVLEMTATDRLYMVPKLFFAYGLGVSYFALGTGATHVLFDGRPTVADVIDHVTRHRPTLFFAVPTFLAQLLAAGVPAGTFETVRAAITGGETLPADIWRRCGDELGLTALDSVGSTEVAHIYVANRLDRQRGGSSGWAVEGFDIELRDEAGNQVPDGEPGQMYVAGQSVTPGYWRRTDHNRRTFHGRFMATGDTFVRNPDDSYTYLGRNDDMIKAGGIWVSPAEVEAAIVELPEVVLAAVVGKADDDGLVKPKAFVVLAEGAEGGDETVALVQNHVKATLAPFKYPRWVEFVEELPTTATGKVKRHLLRDG
jgi:benzoate-CoA ligase family protein